MGGFTARVNHLVADGRVFSPVGDQSPAQHSSVSGAATILPDHQHLLGGSDVVARSDGRNVLDAKALLNLVCGRGEYEASAHGVMLLRRMMNTLLYQHRKIASFER